MENAVRSYLVRVIVLHVGILLAVMAVLYLAGRTLYASAQQEAEAQALESLSAPAVQTRDALQRFFVGTAETLKLTAAEVLGGRDGAWSSVRGRVSDLVVLKSSPDGTWEVTRRLGNEPAALGEAGTGAFELRSTFAGEADFRAVLAGLGPWLTDVAGTEMPDVGTLLLPQDDGSPGVTRAVLPLAGRLPASSADGGAVLALGFIPAEILDDQFLEPVRREGQVTVLLDADGRFVAGVPLDWRGRPPGAVTDADDLPALPESLVDFMDRTTRGLSDARRVFTGRVDIGPFSAGSVIGLARSVRTSRPPALADDAAGAQLDPTGPTPAGEDQIVEGQVGEGPAGGARRMWIITLLDRDAAVAPLGRTTQAAVFWAAGLVLTVSLVLFSSSIHLVRGRSEMIRLRSEVLEKEMRQARQIQILWLPEDANDELGEDHPVSIAAHNLPASHISGDFYNYFALPGGRIGIAIGDVTGHGMSAAFLMATTQLLVKTTLQRCSDAGQTLEEVNGLLCSQQFHGQFVTLLLAVLDPAARTLDVASAGHPPPVACRRPASPDQAEAEPARYVPLDVEPQIVLGVMADAAYPTQRVDLGDSDALLLYTDGLVEAMDRDGKLLELPGMCDRLTLRLPDGPRTAGELAEAALGIVREWSDGADAQDDLTLIAVVLESSGQAVSGVQGPQEAGSAGYAAA